MYLVDGNIADIVQSIFFLKCQNGSPNNGSSTQILNMLTASQCIFHDKELSILKAFVGADEKRCIGTETKEHMQMMVYHMKGFSYSICSCKNVTELSLMLIYSLGSIYSLSEQFKLRGDYREHTKCFHFRHSWRSINNTIVNIEYIHHFISSNILQPMRFIMIIYHHG